MVNRVRLCAVCLHLQARTGLRTGFPSFPAFQLCHRTIFRTKCHSEMALERPVFDENSIRFQFRKATSVEVAPVHSGRV
jgi:hypothetical protein